MTVVPVHVSTDAVPLRDRAAFLAEEVFDPFCRARALPSGPDVSASGAFAVLAPGLIVARSAGHGFTSARDLADIRSDDDDDFSLFIGATRPLAIEQGETRAIVRPGQAMLVGHNRPKHSHWTGSKVHIVRFPRSLLPATLERRAQGATQIEGTASSLIMLRALLATGWRQWQGGGAPPPSFARHVGELIIDLFAETPSPDGHDARDAARLGLMLDALRRWAANPELTMTSVAAAAGLSRRAGYLLFERNGLSFTDSLAAIRLDRARERLLADPAARVVDVAFDCGFGDLSGFNRRFRARFGTTPSAVREE